MFNNTNNFGAGNFYGNGFGPAQQYQAMRKPRFTNPLTEEDKKMLKTQGGFSLFVDDKDMKRALCTHKDGDQISLRENADGTQTCWVCGKTFNIVDTTPETVTDITNQFLDVLESIKTYYLDIPEGVVKEFFQMIPFIAKTPEIYKLALDNFHSYENPMTSAYNQGNQLFGMYDSMSSPGYAYNPNFQQPMMGYGMGMPQQPQYAPQGYTMPAPMPNGAQPVGGFGYVDNGMMPGTTPVQMSFGQPAPAQAAPQQAPQQPAQPAAMPQPGTNVQPPQAGQTTPTDQVNQTKTFAI